MRRRLHKHSHLAQLIFPYEERFKYFAFDALNQSQISMQNGSFLQLIMICLKIRKF